MVAKTRSSRLFVVLVHFVGVSTHLRQVQVDVRHTSSSSTTTSEQEEDRKRWGYSTWKSWGMASHKTLKEIKSEQIILEKVLHIREPLTEAPVSSSLPQGEHRRDDSISFENGNDAPYWLQDTLTGDCLGPFGDFSDCGDVTLWKFLSGDEDEHPRAKGTTRGGKRRTRGRWGRLFQLGGQGSKYVDIKVRDPKRNGKERQRSSQGLYALQLVDPAAGFLPPCSDSCTDITDDGPLPVAATGSESQLDCLRHEQDAAVHKSERFIIGISSCSTQGSPYIWSYDNGILFSEEETQSRRRRPSAERPLCLARNTTSSSAIMQPCNSDVFNTFGLDVNVEGIRAVHLTLVRQTKDIEMGDDFSTIASGHPGRSFLHDMGVALNEKAKMLRRHNSENFQMKTGHLPPAQSSSSAHLSGSGAVASHKHSLTRDDQRPSSISLSGHATSIRSDGFKTRKIDFFKDSNPILLAGDGLKSTDTKLPFSSFPPNKQGRLAKPVGLHKMKKHPYIEASKNGLWEDPQTGLFYRTDLCEYLGHSRKEAGRHTLTGVGLYTRTVFNIKVYGVAFYVSKRDVLADPKMRPFASLEEDELRLHPEFYSVLRLMESKSDPGGGKFDRTLFVKTNMQLGTDTMRSSLESDWKMLTEEGKRLLIDSSLKPRPASKEMLRIIEDSAENPSRCSCAQIAPESVEHDPSCCARGTELVFTWRKSGDLEVRLNGDFMDTFPRPDVAAGIFFEYLRLDDPMSQDFLERVIDGFPFLLGPLSIMNDVDISVAEKKRYSKKLTGGPVQRIGRAFETAMSSVSSQASQAANVINHGITALSTRLYDETQSLAESGHHFLYDVNLRKEGFQRQLSSFAHHVVSSALKRDVNVSVATLVERIRQDLAVNKANKATKIRHMILEKLLSGFEDEDRFVRESLEMQESVSSHHLEVDEWPGPDNSVERAFIGLVHMYLLLMFIASIPLPARRKKLARKEYFKDDGSECYYTSDSESETLSE